MIAGALLGAAGLLLAAANWPGRGAAGTVLLRPDDAALVATGARVYAETCAACHGTDLEGQPDWRVAGADGRLPAPPHDETGHTWHHDDATLFALTKEGLAAMLGEGSGYETDMPAYAGVLADEEILAVLSYIKSRWPAEVRARHDAINARAEP